MTKYFFSFLFFAFFLTSCVSAPVQVQEPQLPYSYAQLKLLDLEQMSDLIQQNMNKYKKTGEARYIEEALVVCLSRPNSDSMVEKLIESIRYNLETNELWEGSVSALVQKSINRLNDPSTAVSDQVGYLILLENLIAEFKPEFVKQYQSPQFESRIIEQIAKSEIEVSREADSESRLNLMAAQKSPAEIAESLVEDRTVSLKSQ